MYKIHTYISLVFCIPLVIVCFTGSVLVYKDEINNILMPGVIYVAKNSDENEQKSRLKFDELRKKNRKRVSASRDRRLEYRRRSAKNGQSLATRARRGRKRVGVYLSRRF